MLSRCANWILREWPKRLGKADSEDLPVPRVLAPNELVTRFICSESHIRKKKARPKPSAFNPSPHIELSVAHTSGLPNAEIWDLGKQTLGSEPGREKLHGRADVQVQSFVDVRLRTLRDDRPFKRHTCVVDWPLGSDANETKELWKQITLELSEDSRVTLVLPKAPIVR